VPFVTANEPAVIVLLLSSRVWITPFTNTVSATGSEAARGIVLLKAEPAKLASNRPLIAWDILM
jgi:hypothetical protein